MQFDEEIRRKIQIELPKLSMYDSKENEELKKKYVGSIYNGRDIFTKVMNVQLQYDDSDQLFANNNITNRMMVFFFNYLQRENIIRGQDLSKKLFFAFINITSYDAEGNLEYDTMEPFQQYLILPTYTHQFTEVILMIKDEERWYSLYLNKDKQIGQLFDFKNSMKVNVYENLEVLNQIILSEFQFQITDFDIRVLTENVNVETDGGFFIINLLYKLVQGVPLENLMFNSNEKGILKDRIDWLVLKSKELIENIDNPMKKRGQKKFTVNESEDILLDQSDYNRKNMHSKSQSKIQDKINSNKKKYNDDQFSENDSMLISQDQKNQKRQPTIFINKGRQKTKLLTLAQSHNHANNANSNLLNLINNNNKNNIQNNINSDLQESFDNRSQNELKQQAKRGKNYEDLRQISYQESVNDDLEQMWKFKQGNQKKYDDNQNELEKMWDFKNQYKKGLRKRNNIPMLIPEEHLKLYQQRGEQPSIQRDFQDRVIDIVFFLENPENHDLLQNPTLKFAVNRLKQQLGVRNTSTNNDIDDQDELTDPNKVVKTKGMGDLKKLIKQKILENTAGDLDTLLEKQKILNEILDYDVEERQDLEKRFENEIQKIDLRFQQYMQKYDALNQYESLQQMYKNAYYGPPDNQISDMKDSMHKELHNYLLSGLGLSSQFSNNPIYSSNSSISEDQNKFNSHISQNLSYGPGFNQRYVKNQDFLKNNSMINLNVKNSDNRNNSQFKIKLNNNNNNNSLQNSKNIHQNQNKSRQNQNNSLSNNSYLNNSGQNGSQQKNNQFQSSEDAIAMRYNVIITQKNLIDVLTQDRLDEEVINFIFGYLEEQYFHENKRDYMVRDENRIFLFPLNFYSELCNRNPLVQQHQLNFNEVSKYTRMYINNHTIFNEFDKLIIPIRLPKQSNFALCVVDINVRQIIYFQIIKGNLDQQPSHSNSDIQNSNNSSLANSNQIQTQEIQITNDPLKNPVSLNILRYLEKEYQNKFMKNFQILNWSLSNMTCSQTSSSSLSPYYLLIYIRMIYTQDYHFNKVNSQTIKNFKLWIPEVFKTVGLTSNKIGEINYFVSLK